MITDPFCLDEVRAILEIYEGLHGQDLGRRRFRQWLEGKQLTEEAFDFIFDLYRKKEK